ncbi:TlpA family protein disulfide reductase [Polaribacter sp. IC073]|uniref:TlpA family protein disulfide reductase n=1 Tax=Polaribacter sp. IC073 TaxID=2508540 RepID=UPI0011BEDD66|nr:thioredoxin family protein [Polaribacter sp. IC073]TXD50052.1 redoxin domain-containing protein [Polaribacter sp. IC073]
MKLRGIIYLIVFSLLLNCKKKITTKKGYKSVNSIIEKNDSYLNKVVITGTTDDIIAFKHLNLLNNTYLFGRSHLNTTKEIFPDSLHMVLNLIEKPLFMEVIASSDKAFYRGQAFITPGDTMSIRIKKGVMKFFGKNAIYNNYYSEMNKHTPKYSKNPYLGSLNRYKKKLKYIYKKKIDFFNQYIEKHNLQSELFLNTIKTHLKHEYLNALINPKNIKSRIDGLYFGEIDGLMPLIQIEADKNSEVIIDLSNYFEIISIEEFKDVNALNNSVFFKDNINPYIRYYFLDSKHLAYSKEKFLAEKEFIQNNFEGEIENYAIARMIRDYHLKGFGNSINSIELLKNTINEYEQRFTKQSYIEFMNDIKEDLKSFNFEISEYALNSKFININGDTLSLKKIFARSNNRIKVIDFWATWCPPCIKQIKEGKAFKDRLQVENNVEWIYISPEKDYEKWVEANKKFEHVLNFNNSFFLLKGLKSSLARTFKVKEIPRYVILNKENKIVLNNAPSPSDNENFEKIIDRIYRKEKE